MLSRKIEDRIRQFLCDYEQIDNNVIESVPNAVSNLISDVVEDIIKIVKEKG